MTIKNYGLTILALVITLIQPLRSQYYEYSIDSGIGIPYFELVIHKQFDEDCQSNRLVLIAHFLNDDLTFVKSDSSGYDANFELLLAVYDQKDQVVISRTINKKINVQNFESTNSREEKCVLKEEMQIAPGKYKLLSRALDLISNKSAQRKSEINLPEYREKKLDISGVLFLQSVQLDTAGKIIDFSPAIGNNFNAHSGNFYIYFDIFATQAPGEISIRYLMTSKKSGDGFDTTIVHRLNQKVSSHLLQVDKAKLKKNKYTLRIEAKYDDVSVSKEQAFSFYWSDIPNTTDDFDLALRQMAYILLPDTLDKYEKANLEEKQSFFRRYWAERDPDPATAKNELKNEYFKRINYANQQFTAFGQDGWMTDRGRILIKFGFPDDIERHPFEMGERPYEIWRYYTLRKMFLFEDRSGFGDYRLHPNYLDVEFQ